MKIEIEKSEYDRLKSREEKLMAYYEWFVDKENDLATVEDIVNKNIELEEENKRLQSSLDYANRDREDMHNKIVELWNKRESQRNMNYKLRGKIKRLEFDVDAWHQLKLLLEWEIEKLGKERDEYKEKLNKAWLEEYWFFNEY